VDISPFLSPFLSLLPLVPYGGSVVGAAALVSMALPPPPSNASALYSGIYQVVNTLGANAFHATNATAPSAKPPPEDPAYWTSGPRR
jgi:hypothetical protein